MGADLPRLPFDGPHALAPGRRRAARAPRAGPPATSGRPSWCDWAGRMLAFYSASRRGGSPCIGVAARRAARRPVARPRAGPVPARRHHRRRPFTDADGTRWLLFKAPRHRPRHLRDALQRAPAARRRPCALAHRPRRSLGAGRHRGPDAGAPGRLLPALLRRRALLPPALHVCGGRRPRGVAARSLREGSRQSAAGRQRGVALSRAMARPSTSGAAGLFLLHHAYRADDADDRRRSALLDRIDVGADGWPTIAAGQGPAITLPDRSEAARAHCPPASRTASAAASLAPGWEWPFFAAPDARPEARRAAHHVPRERAPAELPRAPGPGRPLHGRGDRRRPPRARSRRRARRARSRAHPARHRVAQRSLRAFRADDRSLALGPATRAPAGARMRLLLSATARRHRRPLCGGRRRRAAADRGRPGRDRPAGRPAWRSAAGARALSASSRSAS